MRSKYILLSLSVSWTLTLVWTNPPPKTFVSCHGSNFDKILKVGSWECIEQIPTFTVTFVQATFVLATFVHIRSISAVTDPILTKLLGRILEHIVLRFQMWRPFSPNLSNTSDTVATLDLQILHKELLLAIVSCKCWAENSDAEEI